MQPVSSDASAYPGESSAKIPKTPCGTVKRAFRVAFPPHAADSGGLSLPWLRVWSADAHQGLFVSLPDVHGDDNFRRFAGIYHRVDAAFSLRAAGDVSDGAADSGAPPVLWGCLCWASTPGQAGRSRCSSLACATKPSPSPAPLTCRRRLTAAGSTCG